MWDSRRENRIFVRVLLASLLLIAVLAILYLLFSERIISDLYSGKRAKLLGMRVHPEEMSRADCVQDANQRFVNFVVVGFPLSLACLFLIYKLFRFLFSKIGVNGDELSIPAPKYDWLLATVVYTVLTIAYFLPCLGTINSALIGPAEDNMQTYWGLSWGFEHYLRGTASLTYLTDLFYPEGSSFYYHSWSFYNQIASALLRQFSSQVTAYNLLILLTFPIAGLGAFLLFKYLIRNPYLSLLGGFLFAFNPSHFAHSLHHLNIASIQFVPFFVLYFIKAVRGEGKAALGLAALFYFLNSLCDWNCLIFGFSFMAFGYIYLAIRRRRLFLGDVALKAGIVLGVTVAALSPWLIPMIALGLRSPQATALGHHTFVGDLVGLVVPSVFHLTGSSDVIKGINSSYTANLWESAVYLGLVGLAVVAFAWRAALSKTSRYVVGALAFLLMALGPQPHFLGQMLPVILPDRIVMMLPLLGNARCPSRHIVYVYLFWSMIVSISVGYLLGAIKSFGRKMALMAIIPVLLVVDYFSVCDQTAPVSVPKCYEVMERSGERYGVLDLPSGYGEVDRYMMYQSFHKLPIVQGWASRKLSKSLIDTLEFVDLAKQKRQLADAKVRYIVIHKMLLPRKEVDPQVYAQYYQRSYEDDQTIVFKVY